MKTQNELNALKKEYEELNAKLRELTGEELAQVRGSGNSVNDICESCGKGPGYCESCPHNPRRNPHT